MGISEDAVGEVLGAKVSDLPFDRHFDVEEMLARVT
jgi:hypothetical protein